MSITQRIVETGDAVMAATKPLMPKSRFLDEHANINVITTFIVAAIFMAIGVVILYQVQVSTPAIPNTSAWYTTQSTLATTTQSGYGLLGITLIVIAAAGILGSLFMFVRSRND